MRPLGGHTSHPGARATVPFWLLLAGVIFVVVLLATAILLADVSGPPNLDSIGLPP